MSQPIEPITRSEVEHMLDAHAAPPGDTIEERLRKWAEREKKEVSGWQTSCVRINESRHRAIDALQSDLATRDQRIADLEAVARPLSDWYWNPTSRMDNPTAEKLHEQLRAVLDRSAMGLAQGLQGDIDMRDQRIAELEAALTPFTQMRTDARGFVPDFTIAVANASTALQSNSVPEPPANRRAEPYQVAVSDGSRIATVYPSASDTASNPAPERPKGQERPSTNECDAGSNPARVRQLLNDFIAEADVRVSNWRTSKLEAFLATALRREREAALEEAATVCAKQSDDTRIFAKATPDKLHAIALEARAQECGGLAAAIRALKEKS